ncbi:hypothetical protein V6N11_013738 [Hibiscus sabdariffa]|uniref:Uncharacterized protein n=1 Tax=Hibiscus sabdariffa TaxID=183260 RepID=A0ABR2PCU6_9ROSI
MYLRSPLLCCWTRLYPDWAMSDGSASRGLSTCGLRFTDLDGGIHRLGLELGRSAIWVGLGSAGSELNRKNSLKLQPQPPLVPPSTAVVHHRFGAPTTTKR